MPQKRAWYYSGFFVALSLLFFFPVGLTLMWKGNVWPMAVRVIVSIVFGLVVVSAIGDKQSGSTASAPRTAATTAAPAAAPAPVQRKAITESCYTVSKKFGPSSDLSDLQKDEAWKQYKGGQFKWKLKIVEVREATFSGYRVTYKCSPKSPSLISDLTLSYGENFKDAVIGLKKGGVYEIDGVLKSTGSLLGLSGDGLSDQ